jgi:hypothetical protein
MSNGTMAFLLRVSDMVRTWSEAHGTAASGCEWHSYALKTPQGSLVLVDPLPLSEAAMAELEAEGPPGDIFITSGWHVRDAPRLKELWGCRILAHEKGVGRIEAPIDATVRDGESLWGIARACHLPFVDVPEETGLFIGSKPAVLIVCEAFCGPRTDIGVPPGEIAVYPRRQIPDPAAAARMFRQLLDLPFEVLAFGHGEVLTRDPRGALERLIKRLEGRRE